jgi:hypothetical protein
MIIVNYLKNTVMVFATQIKFEGVTFLQVWLNRTASITTTFSQFFEQLVIKYQISLVGLHFSHPCQNCSIFSLKIFLVVQ